jgi:AcrR family transcriptional regulator
MNSGQQRRAKGSTVDAQVQARLLNATIDLLTAGGTEAATSRAIARAAGENLASITYYFGSKRELLSQAMTATSRRLIQPVVDEFADDTKDSVAKLLAAVQQLYQILNDNQGLLGPYLHSLAAAPTNDTVATEIRSLHRELAEVLATEIASQLSEGQLPDWIEPHAMAKVIVALVNGVAVSIAIDPTQTDPATVGTQFARLLLAARSPRP